MRRSVRWHHAETSPIAVSVRCSGMKCRTIAVCSLLMSKKHSSRIYPRTSIRDGDCVRIPDDRIGRVRAVVGSAYRVRVRRKTSQSHQFLMLAAKDLQRVDCPKGWMSPIGYLRYLRVTLAKMRQRLKRNQ